MKNAFVKTLLFINNHAFLWLWFCFFAVLYALYNLYMNLDKNSLDILMVILYISVGFAINYFIKCMRYSTYKNTAENNEIVQETTNKSPESSLKAIPNEPKQDEQPAVQTIAKTKLEPPKAVVVQETKIPVQQETPYVSSKKKSKDVGYKSKVIEYRKKYPNNSQSQCSEDLGISISTVRRWWRSS